MYSTTQESQRTRTKSIGLKNNRQPSNKTINIENCYKTKHYY